MAIHPLIGARKHVDTKVAGVVSFMRLTCALGMSHK